MPQFTKVPGQKTMVVTQDPSGELTRTPTKKKKQGATPAAPTTTASATTSAASTPVVSTKTPTTSGTPAATTSSTPAASTTPTTPAKTPAQIRAAKDKKKADQKKKADNAAAAADRNANRYNPLMTPFDSPQAQSQQAYNLALLGNPKEAALKAQSAQQQAGIAGLTGALQGRLGQINTQNIAGNAGLADVYSQIAAQTQSAGQSAAAAAGASPTLAAGGNPMVASNAANLNAQTTGLVPAAGFQGNVFANQASSALTKALVDRATNVSSDTAKYLKQIQDQAYAKATGQQTIRQNDALLGFKKDQLTSQNIYHQGQLQNQADRNSIALGNLNARIKADTLKYGATSTKTLDAAMKRILDQQISLTAQTNRPTALNDYTVQVIDPITQSISTKTVTGTDAASAVANSLPAGTQIGGQAIPQGPHMQYGYPDKTQLVSSLASSLVLASRKTANPWTMAKATKWILANATSVAALP